MADFPGQLVLGINFVTIADVGKYSTYKALGRAHHSMVIIWKSAA